MKKFWREAKVTISLDQFLSQLNTSATVLDDRIDGFAELIRIHYHVDELGDPASTTEVRLFLQTLTSHLLSSRM